MEPLQRYEVILVRYSGDLADLRPVPVPEHIAKYHAAVRAFLDRGSRHVGKEHRPRAARILQAIADETPRRGLEVSAPEVTRHMVGDHTVDVVPRIHLVLRTPAGLYPVRIEELTVRVERPPEAKRPGRPPVPSWMLPAPEYVGSGRLELVMEDRVPAIGAIAIGTPPRSPSRLGFQACSWTWRRIG